ncbi:hypothetical protein [Streptomyces sp. NPDC001380]|uniref:hypothetical protein n=1 Tax=Streptomyces sp. NPDC001380 TaxID=3364566 RepID=UPI0036CE4F44
MSFTPPPPPPIPPSPPAGPPGGPRTHRGARIAAAAAGAVLLATGAGTALLATGRDPGRAAAAPSPSASTRPAPPSASPTPGDTPDLPYVVLKPGTCFDHPNLTKGLRTVVVRPCDGPHDGEAVADVTLKGDFTRDSQISKAVYRQCTAAGKRTANRQGEGRRFYSYVLTPSAELYRRGYDQATCTLTGSDRPGGAKLTAKLR